MPRKENVKAKAWERDRRDRMNGYFKDLSDLLPPQVDGRKRNKIDILIQASKYIKELQSRSDQLFYEQASEAHIEELDRLKKLVSQLISRTELLSDLLQNAGITVPAEPALEKISPLKWSNKINVVLEPKITDTVEKDKKGEKKKQNIINSLSASLKKKAIKVKRTAKQSIVNKSSPKKLKSSVEDQENHVDNDSSGRSAEEKDETSLSCKACFTTSSTLSDFSPPKREIRNHKKVKRKRVITKKTSVKGITEFKSLPQGTLVFQNGKIMPVVTPIQPLTPNIIMNASSQQPNPIILNNTQQGQMIVVQPLQANHFQTVSTVKTMTLNAVQNIQAKVLINPQDWTNNVKTIINSSKIGGTKGILPKIREVTQTTMSYKVPIPAINKNKSDSTVQSKAKSTKGKEVKNKTVKKPLKKNQDFQVQDCSNSENKNDKTDNSSISNDKSNTKNALKRNVDVEIDETDKKKLKVTTEKEKVSENILVTPKNILDKVVTCKSLESLKQVVKKIGEDTLAPAKVDLKESQTNSSDSNNDKQKTDNNSLNETSSISVINAKPSIENLNCINKGTVNEESCDLKVSNDVKKSSTNKAVTTSNVQIESQSDLPKIDVDKEVEKSLASVSEEASLQTKKSVLNNEKTVNTSNANYDEKETLSNEKIQSSHPENGMDVLLQTSVHCEIINDQAPSENNKIFLNLDTNTTTTMKLEILENRFNSISSLSTSPAVNTLTEDEPIKLKNSIKDDQSLMKAISYCPSNSFIPIHHKPDALHSDLSNDIFASLQVPSSSNNSESISPTAAFLLAFPIVSSLAGKTEVLDDDIKDDFKYSSQTPPMLLQIGAIEPNSFKLNSKPVTQEVNEPVQVKSSIEPVTSTVTSTSEKTSVKPLPRVINSQTITESYRIIPVSTEQTSRQLNTAMNTSSQMQINSRTNANSSVASNSPLKDQRPTNTNNTFNTDNSHRNQHPTMPNNMNTSMSNSTQTYTSSSSGQPNYVKYLPVSSIQNPMNNQNLNKCISTSSSSVSIIGEDSSNKYKSVATTLSVSTIDTAYPAKYTSIPCSLPGNMESRISNKYSSIPTPLSTNKVTTVSSNNYNIISTSIPTNSTAKVTFSNYSTVSTLLSTNTVATISSNRYSSIPNSLPMNTMAKTSLNNYSTVSTLLPTNTVATVSSNKYNFISTSLPTYTAAEVSSSNNYNTVSTLTTIRTVAAVSSSKYNPTSLPMNPVDAVSQNKYNPISHYVSPSNQTLTPSSVASNSKEIVYRNNNSANNHFNFPFSSANEEDLSKIQICPMEYFTVRSNEYSLRHSKDNSYANQSLQTNNPEAVNKTQVNQDKSPKAAIHNNQNVNANANYHPGKKIENKGVNMNSSEGNLAYSKKPSEMQNPNLYANHCDNKVNKKITPPSSQPTSSIQKSNHPVRSGNIFPDQTGSYTVATNYEENDIARTTTTVANNSSNFSILSWTTFPPMNNNGTSYPQYDPTSVSNEATKTTCENFNYLPTSKDVINVSVPHTVSSTYSSTDFQMPTFDKPKSKLPNAEAPKRSYTDKSRSMRLPQTTSQIQKSPRSHNQTTASNSDYKFPADNKTKYKYPMDMNFAQSTYPNKLDLPPYHVQNHQNQPSQALPNHQVSTNSKAITNQHQPSKLDKTINYMLPDYNVHANFSGDLSHVQPRYSNISHDAYNSGSYKYTDKSPQIHPKYQPSPQAPNTPMHQEISPYNSKHVQQQQQQQQQQHQPQQNQTKQKTDSSNHIQPTQQQQQQPQQQQQQVNQHQTIRPPVNWMMTPEIKHNPNIPDMILPPIGKELEFCQNNIFSQSSSNYNQPGTNHQFYNNYDMTAHTFPSNIAPPSGVPSEPKKSVDPSYYAEDQTFSWSPTKNLLQSTEQSQNLKNVESSLVGDLALNSDKQNNFTFGQVPVRSSNSNEISKATPKDKNINVPNRDYQAGINSQSNQQQQQQQQQQHQPNSTHGMPFLSVSQLVDHEKVNKNQHQIHSMHQPSHSGNNTTSHHHQQQHHQHSNPPQQQQQTQQTPTRKQRKGSNSPRSKKQQMDMRSKQSANNNNNNSGSNSGNEQIHRHHVETKNSSTAANFADSANYQQQQQKYNQQNNDAQWRSRNCKSNYTAEALIGTTNSTENTSSSSTHAEKNNVAKYSTNYPTQNKFNSDPMSSINYFSNVDDSSSSNYGQMMNQNFNHSYSYPSNANIYPSTNFIPNISNSSASNYMMTLHENAPDYLEGSNNFLLPPTTSTTPLLTSSSEAGGKNHPHHYQPSKHQNCDKRLYYATGQQKKGKGRKSDPAQNLDFSGISGSPLVDDYHPHHHHHHHHAPPATFLTPPNPLYQNQATNVYAKSSLPPPPPSAPSASVMAAAAATSSSSVASTTTSASSSTSQVVASTATTSNNPMTAMTQQHHHPSGTSLTNFHVSAIFPEINDKVTGYKPTSANAIATSHATSSSYAQQRTNYADPLGQMPQSSDSATHFNGNNSGGGNSNNNNNGGPR